MDDQDRYNETVVRFQNLLRAYKQETAWLCDYVREHKYYSGKLSFDPIPSVDYYEGKLDALKSVVNDLMELYVRL